MAGEPYEPLSLDEAKAQFRAVARESSPAAWVRRHPRQAVLMALMAGMLAATNAQTRTAVAQTVTRFLLKP